MKGKGGVVGGKGEEVIVDCQLKQIYLIASILSFTTTIPFPLDPSFLLACETPV